MSEEKKCVCGGNTSDNHQVFADFLKNFIEEVESPEVLDLAKRTATALFQECLKYPNVDPRHLENVLRYGMFNYEGYTDTLAKDPTIIITWLCYQKRFEKRFPDRKYEDGPGVSRIDSTFDVPPCREHALCMVKGEPDDFIGFVHDDSC